MNVNNYSKTNDNYSTREKITDSRSIFHEFFYSFDHEWKTGTRNIFTVTDFDTNQRIIYSYGTHYILAILNLNENVVFINSISSSRTTEKHKSYLWQAIPAGYTRVSVELNHTQKVMSYDNFERYCKLRNNYYGDDVRFHIQPTKEYYRKHYFSSIYNEYKGLCNTIAIEYKAIPQDTTKKREIKKASELLNSFNHNAIKFMDLCKLLGYKPTKKELVNFSIDKTDDVIKQIELEKNRRIKAEKIAREQAIIENEKRIKENAVKIEILKNCFWNNTEKPIELRYEYLNRLGYNYELLRIETDSENRKIIVTTQGVKISAKLIYREICKYLAGELKINDKINDTYVVKELTGKYLQIGCHKIEHCEIVRIYDILKECEF